ncbi:MAG TPA: hypothetical protein VI488_17095 [Candidatus Angelobacter sp.]
MTKRICRALTLAVLAALLSSIISPAWAQESEEKSAKEQNPGDKGKTESGLADSEVNFPQAQGPVELRPARGTRITLKMDGPSRAVYEAIGKQAKISVLFDPDYTPRNISVDIEGVPLQDALKIVAFQSRTFWRPVTSDAIFVAADTQGKRREIEQQVIKTFYFPNLPSPTDLQDVVNSLRTLLDIQRVQQVPTFQSILVRGTPEQMAAAEKLVDDLNRSKEKIGGEYRLEFKISDATEGKKTSKTYTLLTEPLQTGKLRIGSKVPIDFAKTYNDIGKNIDCVIRSESEHAVSLRLTVEVSAVATDERGVAGSAPGNPVIEGVHVETNVTLQLATPTIVSNFQDPVTKHDFQIEVTATRTKSKE